MSGYDVFGVGRAVMDRAVLLSRYPGEDEKTEAVDRFEGSGSPVPNALCQLGVWGHRTGLSAVVGDDLEGERFLEQVRRFGVDTTHATRRAGQRTPQAHIWVNARSGSRTVVLDRDIAPLSPGDVPLKDLAAARFLLIDGYEADAALAAAEVVRGGGGQVMIDAGHPRDRMDEQFALCDWIIVPVAYAKADHPGEDLFQVARILLGYGAEGVVVTNGAAGGVMAWDDQVQWYPAFKVDGVVDTTGAGDLFHAGFLHGRLMGWDLPDCVRWAAAVAALGTTRLGGRGWLPGVEDVTDFLVRQGQEDGPWLDDSRGV